jgi:hypothetical protein
MPPDLKDVLLLAFMNPATIAAGFWVGRKVDQREKIVLAGFIAGVAGVAFAGLLMLTGLFEPKVRLLGGVLVASGLLGILWASIGYASRPQAPDPD